MEAMTLLAFGLGRACMKRYDERVMARVVLSACANIRRCPSGCCHGLSAVRELGLFQAAKLVLQVQQRCSLI